MEPIQAVTAKPVNADNKIDLSGVDSQDIYNNSIFFEKLDEILCAGTKVGRDITEKLVSNYDESIAKISELFPNQNIEDLIDEAGVTEKFFMSGTVSKIAGTIEVLETIGKFVGGIFTGFENDK